MRLLVFYSYRLFDELMDEERICENQCSVSCPENLPVAEFKNYVYKNYYDKIFDIEKNTNGSYQLKNLSIHFVKYLMEL